MTCLGSHSLARSRGFTSRGVFFWFRFCLFVLLYRQCHVLACAQHSLHVVELYWTIFGMTSSTTEKAKAGGGAPLSGSGRSQLRGCSQLRLPLPWHCHWLREVRSRGPRAYGAPEALEVGLELPPRKSRGEGEGGRRGFRPRTRPKGETVPG